MLLKLFIKDLKVLLSDKKGLMIFILMPIVLTTILSFALSGSFGDPGRMDPIPVAIVKAYDAEKDEALFMETMQKTLGSTEAIELIDLEAIFFDTFLGDAEIQKIITPQIMSEADAFKALEEESVYAVVTLPEQFIYNQWVNLQLPNRNPIDVLITKHPDYSYSVQIVESVMGSYFDELNKKMVGKNVYLEVGSKYLAPEQLFQGLSGLMAEETDTESRMSHVDLKTIPSKKAVSSFTYYAIAMMGMFILYSAGYTGRELLREKKMLTLDRGVVSGVHYGLALTSKFLMTMALCLMQMSALLLYSKLMLGVDWENPAKIIVGIFFSSLAVSGVGVLISAITLSAENYRIANVFENLLVHLFALIGGSYIPIEVLPKIFMTLKYFALNGIVIDLFIGIYQNDSWSNMVFYYGLLSGIGVVFTAIAAFIIIRKEASTYEGVIKA